jgi:molecular chaperone GrpE (heat shock protein)
VNERNLTPEPIPIVPAQSAPAAPPAADPETGITQTPATHDDRVLRVLGELKSQNEEQLSFQRSNHELVVDLSNRVRQIADEASSRERRAMLLELVMLYDSLEQAVGWVRDSNDTQPKEEIVDRLETLRSELLEILARREVRAYDENYQVLDRRLHRAIKTVPTSDLTLNDRVKTVLRIGFFWREQPLRPEEVIVFKYKPELPEEH